MWNPFAPVQTAVSLTEQADTHYLAAMESFQRVVDELDAADAPLEQDENERVAANERLARRISDNERVIAEDRARREKNGRVKGKVREFFEI